MKRKKSRKGDDQRGKMREAEGSYRSSQQRKEKISRSHVGRIKGGKERLGERNNTVRHSRSFRAKRSDEKEKKKKGFFWR